jgi:lactate dehydrogenase-like 2-hydroxyacid dehydrogenase
MTSHRFVVCYTGADPPASISRHAAENGVDLVSVGGDDASTRIAELRPDGYVMNDPDYGPYLSAELADAIGGLRIVVYHGQTRTAADYEPVMDVAALRQRGIVLTTSPGTATEAVAEGTLALLLALNLNVAAVNVAFKAGDASLPEPRRPLRGGVLGIVGLGSIGQRVARLASAFGMRIVYASRARKFELEDELEAAFLPLGELFERSHYVSIHTPIGTTEALAGREILSRARGIILVNTASAGIVEPEALLEAIERGWIRRAAVDGLYPEPHRSRLNALGDDRYLALPFASWWTTDARDRGWEACLESLVALKEGREVPHQIG